MFLQPSNIPTGYTSLNSSIVTPPKQNHTRTQSHNRLPQNNNSTFTHVRTPSQKKLSLTCQNIPPINKNFKKEKENEIKKKGFTFGDKNTHFVSMGSSRVFEC